MGKETVSKNLKNILKRSSKTQTDMAKDLNINESTVSSWVNGKKYPRRDKIEMMADYFNIMPSDITDNKTQEETAKTFPVVEIPVVSKVSAGMPIYAEENVVDHIFVAGMTLSESKNHFGLIVNGDSMDKEFREGDVVIVEKDGVVENGQIGVVMINGYSATVKRISYQKDMIILQPDSNDPSHQPQIYDETDEVHIIGKVVGMHRSY